MFEESCFMFYLTGSRLWETHSAESDWDFFVQEDEKIEDFLYALGMRGIDYAYKEDKFLEKVYEVIMPNALKVQVQIVKDADIKAEVQAQLLKDYPEGFPSKEEATKIWNTAMRYALLGKASVVYTHKKGKIMVKIGDNT